MVLCVPRCAGPEARGDRDDRRQDQGPRRDPRGTPQPPHTSLLSIAYHCPQDSSSAVPATMPDACLSNLGLSIVIALTPPPPSPCASLCRWTHAWWPPAVCPTPRAWALRRWASRPLGASSRCVGLPFSSSPRSPFPPSILTHASSPAPSSFRPLVLVSSKAPHVSPSNSNV